MRRHNLSVRIVVFFMLLFAESFGSFVEEQKDYVKQILGTFNTSLSETQKGYLKQKGYVRAAYIKRSAQGNSYSDIYNEEIMNLFQEETGCQLLVLRGDERKLSRMENIDIIIDPQKGFDDYSQTTSFSSLPYVYYSLRDNPKEYTDLKRKKIVVLKGDLSPVSAFREFADEIKIITVKSIEEGFQLLRKKEADLFFTAKEDIYMRSPEQNEFLKNTLESNLYYKKQFGIKKDDDQLKKIVNDFVDGFNNEKRRAVEDKVTARLIWKRVYLTSEEREYFNRKKTIKIKSFYEGLAPLMYQKDKRELKGVVTDYLNILKYGTDISIDYSDIQNTGKEIGDRTASLFLVATKEKNQGDILLTQPYYKSTLGVFGLDDKEYPFFRNLGDFLGKRVGAVQYDSIKKIFGREENVGIYSARSIEELYRMLRKEEIDLFIYDYTLMNNSRNMKGMRNLKLYGILDKGILEQEFSFSLGTFEEDKILRDVMNRIINYTDQEELFSKWDFESQEMDLLYTYRKLLITLGIMVMVLVPYLLTLKNEIKKRTSVEVKLLETKKELETALNVKTAFLANMSHELRTPLTAILGFTKLLKKREESERKQKLIENISVAGETLLNFINEILDLSKLESGKVELKYIRINISKIAGDIEKICNGLNKNKNVHFEVSIGEDVPKYFMCDEVRLKEVILNIISNAFKFTKKGKVKLGFETTGEKLLIKIEDTGVGIPTDKLKSIFERYKQLELDEERTGYGLGLAIVKEIVDLMDGEIDMESQYRKGTTFTISLPLKRKLEMTGSVRGVKN